MNIFASLIICFSMYSIIPMIRMDWTEEKMKYCFSFFPLVGAVIGAINFCVVKFLPFLNNNFLAILLLLLPIVISGGIHLDGLIDTCDAIFSYGDKQKKLEILKDPRTGAFGVIGACMYFLLLFGVYSQLLEFSQNLMLLPVVFVISRSLGAFSLLTLKKAKKDGLGASFAKPSAKINLSVLCVYFLLAIAFLCYNNLYIGLTILIIIPILYFWYNWYTKKQFGGVNGDTTGFLISLTELILPLVIACF